MSRRFMSRILPALVVVMTTFAMLAVTDAEARRMGGGGSVGRQSSNVTQRQATPPQQRPQQANQAAPQQNAAAAGGAAAAGTAARSGMSRWLGPVAGIAAGLGLAALFSHLGLGAAMAEMLSSLLLIGLVIFAVLFIVRRFRGQAQGRQPAYQAAANNSYNMQHEPVASARQAAAPAVASAAAPAGAEMVEGEWGIPTDFDTVSFLGHSKNFFRRLQGIWDRGDLNELRDVVTDDLMAELGPQIAQRTGENVTEIVLLNAELLGIEKVTDGHLASVRYSGMLREEAGAEAFRFEEVWNLFKGNNEGWVLAGIQQVPAQPQQ